MNTEKLPNSAQNEQNDRPMDVASKPVSHSEKKNIATTTYAWLILFAAVACIPLFNFLLLPLVMIGGAIAYLVTTTVKSKRLLHE